MFKVENCKETERSWYTGRVYRFYHMFLRLCGSKGYQIQVNLCNSSTKVRDPTSIWCWIQLSSFAFHLSNTVITNARWELRRSHIFHCCEHRLNASTVDSVVALDFMHTHPTVESVRVHVYIRRLCTCVSGYGGQRRRKVEGERVVDPAEYCF